MLINNKNLIKTIKRVDLTNEQETNLNAHYNTDKLHPKKAGYDHFSKIIQNFLESLI